MNLRKSGFTLVELLVVIAIIGVLIALLLPAVQQAREAARRMECQNKLKQLGLACHNFHDTYQRFPTASHELLLTGPGGETDFSGNRHRWSWLTVILPFIEQNALYEDFRTNHLGTGVPWNGGLSVNQARINAFFCPSDGYVTETDGNRGRTSYHCNRGDYWLNYDWHECRGVFGRGDRQKHKMASITDGTSNTFLASEILVGPRRNANRIGEGIAINVGYSNGDAPSLCLARAGANNTLSGDVEHRDWQSGWRWADSHSCYTQWHAVLPPNSPSCGNTAESFALMTASSNHPGGVNVVFVDGSVDFIAETIDAGDATVREGDSPLLADPARPQDYSGPSLRGVWGALGSSYGGEVTGER